MATQESIQALKPDIESILKISGAPGLSVGVLHKGDIIYKAHLGYRDVLNCISPDDDTIYHIASLTKLITALCAATLVEDGTLDWDVPIRQYLPGFRRRTDQVGICCTLRDLLSNRTGLTGSDNLWAQMGTEILIPRGEVLNTAVYVPTVKPFRKNFVYSNWNYNLAQEVIEAVARMSLHQFFSQRVTGPLGMDRTTLQRIRTRQDPNIAHAYNVKGDNSLCEVGFLDMSDEAGHAAAGGGKSTLSDMLTMYHALMDAYAHQFQNGCTSSPGNPFSQLSTVFTPQVRITSAAPVDMLGYCYGIFRTKTPGNLSTSSANIRMLGRRTALPAIGSGSPGVDIFHHQGTFPGFLSTCHLIPSTKSAIIVLSNGYGLLDPTDFVAQIITSVLLGEKPSESYIELARVAARYSISSYAPLYQALEAEKTSIPPSFALAAYKGQYWNKANNYVITISEKENRLILVPQYSEEVQFDLQRYGGDTFYWPADRDQELCEGMMPRLDKGWHKIKFEPSSDNNRVDRLYWHHDRACPPEEFRKRPTQSKI